MISYKFISASLRRTIGSINARIVRYATRGLVICPLMLLIMGNATAQGPWPTKPVTFVVPYAPGGSADLTARAVAEKMSTIIGQTIIVENRPGAGTMLAAEYVAHAAPDGYTIFVSGSSMLIAAAMTKGAKYHPVKSFEHIGALGIVPHLLVVPSSLPVNNIKELVVYLKEKKGSASYASTGVGSTSHLEAELFKKLSGTEMVHIPYKGSSPALIDLITGRVQLMFDAYASSRAYVEKGQLRVLGVSMNQRSKSLPQYPTIAESGLSDFNSQPWLGLSAPAGVERSIVIRLNDALRHATKDEQVQNRYRTMGMEPMDMEQIQFSDFVRRDMVVWSEIIKNAQIQSE